jgi:uncharacterized membrane protein
MNQRYTLIDWLRSFAIVLMVAYHFLWDLKEVGLITRDFFYSFPVRLVGRTCLLTFLFCVGYSLSLSHDSSINWASFFKRWLKLLFAALAISLVTYLMYPKQWVYFGILHHITVMSLVLLVFLRVKLLALTLGLYILIPYWLDSMGLCALVPELIYPWLNQCQFPNLFLFAATMDYIDLIPWSGASLIGLGLSYFKLHEKVQPPRLKPVEIMSRYSFEIYLIHQPVLVALSFALAYVLAS